MKEYSYLKRWMLRELSENSRTSITNLAKKLKCSRNTVISNLRSLEKELGLFYTIDFNKDRMGFTQNQVLCVTLGIKPSPGELEKIFENDSYVQFAAKTDGDFDLLLKIVMDSSDNYTYWEIRTILSLLPYRPVIKASQIVLIHSGYVHVPNSVIERQDLEQLGLDELDKRIIMLLNSNSRTGYREIAKRLKTDPETVRYRLKKILDTKIIRRFTALVTKPPTDYNVAFFANYRFAPRLRQRYDDARRHYVEIDEKIKIVSSFQYLALMSGSYTLFGLGCFESEEQGIKEVVLAHKSIYKEDNLEMSYAKVTEVLKGYLPITNKDTKRHFHAIKWEQIQQMK